MTKQRIPIPKDLSAEVIFASNSTCCICQESGKTLQIHHIDENPSNNVLQNLAVLCLECHNDTQIKGGFGRKTDKLLVIKYRDDWLLRVKNRKAKADEIASQQYISTTIEQSESLSAELARKPSLSYINSLPAFKTELLKHAQPEWNSGVTSRMVQANYDYIDALESILVTLANYYSPKQFGTESPQRFFSTAIASRFTWHRTYAEPDGPGTGGTIINIICGSNVIADVERMIEDFVMSLVGNSEEFDQKNWSLRWK